MYDLANSRAFKNMVIRFGKRGYRIKKKPFDTWLETGGIA
jgi:hypothetical protein